MRKLLLLCSLFILSCSSDDSNDNSNQTFFEKYDGVVWGATGENGKVRVQFINSPMSWVYYDEELSVCITYLFNDETQNPQMNLIYNLGNILTIEEMSDYPIQYSFTVNDEDNTLTLEETEITSYTVFERTTLTDPCE